MHLCAQARALFVEWGTRMCLWACGEDLGTEPLICFSREGLGWRGSLIRSQRVRGKWPSASSPFSFPGPVGAAKQWGLGESQLFPRLQLRLSFLWPFVLTWASQVVRAIPAPGPFPSAPCSATPQRPWSEPGTAGLCRSDQSRGGTHTKWEAVVTSELRVF